MSKVYVFDHPLIQHKTAMIRKEETSVKDFRELVKEIAMLMGYEATRQLPLEEVEITTPMQQTKVNMLKGEDIAIVPILRAGLGLVDGFKTIIPTAKVGHIGMSRNEETLQPEEYYAKFPSCLKEADVIVLDPMLATGGSACAAITNIKKRGAKNIKFACLVAAPEGIQVIETEHPDVDLIVGALDEKLNDKGYIVPGLGDAGDRLFGTD